MIIMNPARGRIQSVTSCSLTLPFRSLSHRCYPVIRMWPVELSQHSCVILMVNSIGCSGRATWITHKWPIEEAIILVTKQIRTAFLLCCTKRSRSRLTTGVHLLLCIGQACSTRIAHTCFMLKQNVVGCLLLYWGTNVCFSELWLNS